jgi:hypothetical protein
VERGSGHNGADGLERVGTRARDEKRRTTTNDFLSDRCNLSRCLSETEHDLWKALPYRAMVIDFRETEVFERPGSKCFEEMLECIAGCDVATRDAIEQFLQQFV